MPEDRGDRRGADRAPLALRVAVFVAGAPAMELYALDLSTDGIFLLTVSPLEPGEEVTLRFGGDGHGVMELRGTVARSQVVVGLGTGSELSGMAVHFRDLDPGQLERVSALVNGVRAALQSFDK